MSRPWLGVSLKASISPRPCLRLPGASARLGQSAGWATRAGENKPYSPTIIGATGGFDGKKTLLVEVIGTFFLSLALFKGFDTVLLALGCGLMLSLGVWFGGGAYNPAVSVASTGSSILGKSFDASHAKSLGLAIAAQIVGATLAVLFASTVGGDAIDVSVPGANDGAGELVKSSVVEQHCDQRGLFAVPGVGSCASSGCAWRLRPAWHSDEEARPLGALPLPRVAASKAVPTFGHPGRGTLRYAAGHHLHCLERCPCPRPLLLLRPRCVRCLHWLNGQPGRCRRCRRRKRNPGQRPYLLEHRYRPLCRPARRRQLWRRVA